MATTLPKSENSRQHRTPDDSFPDDKWLVKRVGNDHGRMPIPCVSCAQSVKNGRPIGYDPSVELGGLFQSRGNSDVRESFESPAPYIEHRCPYADSGPCTCRARYAHRMSFTASAVLVAVAALWGLANCKRR